jgi:hypothetical protein
MKKSTTLSIFSRNLKQLTQDILLNSSLDASFNSAVFRGIGQSEEKKRSGNRLMEKSKTTVYSPSR